MFANAFLLAIKQIWRNPMRSLLTVLGIVIGVAAVITMVTVGNGTAASVKADIESFGNNQLLIMPGQRTGGGRVGAPSFKIEDVTALRNQVGGITAAAPQLQTSATVIAQGRNWSTTVLGTTNDYFTIQNREIEKGRNFEDGEEQGGSSVCVIGTTIEKQLFQGTVSPLDQMLKVKNISCRIIGVMKEKGTAGMGGDQDDTVIMPIKAVERRLVGKSRVSAILLGINPESDRERLKDEVISLMRERRSLSSTDENNFNIFDTAEIAEKVASTTSVLTALLGAVAAVSLLVGGIGIMNIMLVSVVERTREIGVRLAIGATAREVLMQFLIEAVVLSSLGGLMGVLLALGAGWGITKLMDVPWAFYPGINLLSFAVAALTGVIFGYFPARNAARMDPIEAVRHE